MGGGAGRGQDAPGVFDTEAKAEAAYDKELKNAKKLGWGASDKSTPSPAPGNVRKWWKPFISSCQI